MAYQVFELRQAYYPDIQGIERPTPVCGECGEEIVFETIEEAIKHREKLDEERYTTSNNESGRPQYIVTDVDLSHFGDASNYDWDGAECDCGECQTCYEMMIAQERAYIIENDAEASDGRR